MNETLNSVNYYIKLADELIRYPEIKKFIFTSKTFLSFENVSYKLTNQEIILLEDILLNKYFEDLIAIEFNEYLKNELRGGNSKTSPRSNNPAVFRHLHH